MKQYAIWCIPIDKSKREGWAYSFQGVPIYHSYETAYADTAASNFENHSAHYEVREYESSYGVWCHNEGWCGDMVVHAFQTPAEAQEHLLEWAAENPTSSYQVRALNTKLVPNGKR